MKLKAAEEREKLKHEIKAIDENLLAFALNQEEPSRQEINRIRNLHANRIALRERLDEIGHGV